MPHLNSFYQDYRKLLRLYNDGAIFTAFDTETTGLSPSDNRILEIGAIKFNKDGIIDNWNQLFNPQCLIPQFITNLTNISQEMVTSCLTIDNYLNDFISFTDNTVLIGHNVQFDLNFIYEECLRTNCKYFSNKVIDTLRMSRWAYPTLGHWKLNYLAEKMNINPGNMHRALDDAITCKEVFLHILDDTKSIQK